MGEGAHQPGLPETFVGRLRELLPAEALDDALASFGVEKPTAFRVNTLKAQPDKVIGELRASGLTPAPVPGLVTAFSIPPAQRSALTQSALSTDGRIYIHGIASMLAPLALDAQPGESVLDLCAAPGGKTLMLAAMMANTGTLNAVEPGKTRFFKLRANLERGGAMMVKTYHTDGRSVGRKTPGRFDGVLVDAPCAGEAMFTTRDSSSYADWSEKKVKRCARVQKALLRSALEAVRPGGRVLYCTCSMSVEENEGVVSHTLEKLGDAVAVEALPDLPARTMPALSEWRGKTLPREVARAVRVLPTAVHDAFFLAMMCRVY